MKKRICLLVSVCLVISTFFFLQKLLQPKFLASSPEGSLIAEYYQDRHQNDVVFVGDCEVYENISPITLWQKYGITSFTRGSAQQLIWQSYYLMKETLKYEKPKVFVFNVLSMKYGVPQSSEYNRLNLDGMKWSKEKWDSVQASMTEDESIIEYLFPLLRYHSRWNQLTGEDYQYLLKKKPIISHNGFLMRVDELGVDPKDIPTPEVLADYQFAKRSYQYLNMMVQLCKENNIKLVLMKAPTLYPAWYKEWDKQMQDYATKNEVDYINFLDLQKEIGIDWKHDTYDQGLHLNTGGAEKLATYFGKYLTDKYSLTDGRKDKKTATYWNEKVQAYNKEKKAQYAELDKIGYLKSWGAKPR